METRKSFFLAFEQGSPYCHHAQEPTNYVDSFVGEKNEVLMYFERQMQKTVGRSTDSLDAPGSSYS